MEKHTMLWDGFWLQVYICEDEGDWLEKELSEKAVGGGEFDVGADE